MRVAVDIELKHEERQFIGATFPLSFHIGQIGGTLKKWFFWPHKKTNAEIAKELGISRQKVGRWRDCYQQFGLAGIEKDAPRPGRKKKISSQKVKKPIELTIQEKPDNATHWS